MPPRLRARSSIPRTSARSSCSPTVMVRGAGAHPRVGRRLRRWLTTALLRAIGPTGHVTGYEIRDDFAQRAIAKRARIPRRRMVPLDVEVRDVYEGMRRSAISIRINARPPPSPWRKSWKARDERIAPRAASWLAYLPTILQGRAVTRGDRRLAVRQWPKTVEILQAELARRGSVHPAPTTRMVAHTGFLTHARLLAPDSDRDRARVERARSRRARARGRCRPRRLAAGLRGPVAGVGRGRSRVWRSASPFRPAHRHRVLAVLDPRTAPSVAVLFLFLVATLGQTLGLIVGVLIHRVSSPTGALPTMGSRAGGRGDRHAGRCSCCSGWSFPRSRPAKGLARPLGSQLGEFGRGNPTLGAAPAVALRGLGVARSPTRRTRRRSARSSRRRTRALHRRRGLQPGVDALRARGDVQSQRAGLRQHPGREWLGRGCPASSSPTAQRRGGEERETTVENAAGHPPRGPRSDRVRSGSAMSPCSRCRRSPRHRSPIVDGSVGEVGAVYRPSRRRARSQAAPARVGDEILAVWHRHLPNGREPQARVCTGVEARARRLGAEPLVDAAGRVIGMGVCDRSRTQLDGPTRSPTPKCERFSARRNAARTTRWTPATAWCR